MHVSSFVFERCLAEKDLFGVLYYFYTRVDHDEPHAASLCNTLSEIKWGLIYNPCLYDR